MADEAQFTRPNTTIKAIEGQPGRVGGYLVVWGSPAQRDLQGEYFTPETDLGLDWYDQRPALYHHGLDGTLQIETIGVIDTLKTDTVGLWAEAQFNIRNRYVQAVMQLVDKGALGWSSGSLPHLVNITQDGQIKRWPIVEGSMTPSPAEPRNTNIHAIKSAYAELGLDLARLQLPDSLEDDATSKEPQAKENAAKPTGAVDPKLSPTRNFKMDMQTIVQQVLAGLLAARPDWQLTPEEQTALIQQILASMSAPAEQPVEDGMMAVAMQQAAGKAMTALTGHFNAKAQKAAAHQNMLNTAVKGAIATVPPQPAPMFTGGGQSGNGHVRDNSVIEVRTKYADLSAKDMSFLVMLDRHNRSQSGKHPNLKPLIADENYGSFVREMASKAEKDINGRKLTANNLAVKAINALKSDELDHSTQANYGDEWVPDLWSQDLWRRARLENVILPLFRTIDMPSNPFELPVESADPTVYFVPETTNEDQQTIAASTNAIPDSKVGSAKVMLSAKKLALRVGFSAELVEDSIIPVLNIYREQAERAIMDSIDHVLLNGDDTNAATGNINLDDADPADTEKYLAFNGLLHSALVEDTTRKLDAGGVSPTLSLVRATRFKMPAAYAQRPNDIAYIVGGEVFAKLLNLDEFLTMDKVGQQATILNGMIGSIDGSPVLSTAELALAEADGKKSTTSGNNILGRLAAVFRPHWFVGYRRRVAVSVDYLPYYDSYQLSATVRLGFVHQDNDSVGVLYNLAV